MIVSVMTSRSVLTVREAPHAQLGASLSSREVHQALTADELDPFLVVSLFEMRGPVFPPHPHAGFSVATYILPESPVGFINQDSLGTRNEIKPGGLHATVAGSGVLHEEQPIREGLSLGYQIWIDHRNGERDVPPRPETLEAEDVPVYREEGVTLRVLIGAARGLRSPINLPTPVRLLDVDLAAGARVSEEILEAERGFLVVVSGNVDVAGSTMSASQVATISDVGDALELRAGSKGARVTLFLGVPLRQSRVLGGPVVGGTRAEAERFLRSASAGSFGSLRPFAAQRD